MTDDTNIPEPTRACIYCGEDKLESEFSDEHIWPSGLGGSQLEHFWRTDAVCGRCNNASGVYVDGAFIRSWFGNAERATGARDYLSPTNPVAGALPLDYMGRLADAPTRAGHIAEYWVGPCGANIVHVHPEEGDEDWGAYAGGNPRQKKSTAGRAYLLFTSQEPYWILATLAAFKAHFTKAKRIVVNAELTPALKQRFFEVDWQDADQAADKPIVDYVRAASRKDETIRASLQIPLNLGVRFMAKVALAIGFKVFGDAFLATDYARDLRQGFREANDRKRGALPVKGASYLSTPEDANAISALAWPGGWLLSLHRGSEGLTLSVISPSGRLMTIVITADAALLDTLPADYDVGRAWLTIPPLGLAEGPFPLDAYVAHVGGGASYPPLQALADKGIDPATLPPCRR